MLKPKLLILFILFPFLIFAQKASINDYSVVDKKALQLPESLSKTTELIASYITSNFTNDKDKSRAIFIWIASNIEYDIENMFAINYYEKKEDKIVKPLKTRKGICENYAALFTDICIKSGLKSFVIEGYTKHNSSTDNLPHAWCAALINGSWLLFDPTWGAGYAKNGKFYKQINNDYYLISPSSLIKSHIPFDYLWQFLNYPVTVKEFHEGNTQENKNKEFFNFIDSIHEYEKQSHIEQLISSAYRLEKNGVKNSLLFDRLKHIKTEIENEKHNKTIMLYNAAVFDYNEGVNAFNDFISYRNKQFTPKKTDAEIQKMIDLADNKLEETKLKLGQISDSDANTSKMIKQLTKSIDETSGHVKKQKDWLKLYFSKGKTARKAMFYERKPKRF